jgi:signal transduction histidine kinase
VRATDSHADRPSYSAKPELAWLAAWLICVVIMVLFPTWQVVPLDAIWFSLALLYGTRIWPNGRMLVLIATAAATTAAMVGDDMIRHVRILGGPVDQIPLLAMMVAVMAWQAHRWVVTDDRNRLVDGAERLLATQLQLLQDASHELRTPITIALGHAELLLRELTGTQQHDVAVVVGELERLRTLSDRLLLIAASEDTDFLTLAPTDLEALAVDVLRRWRPIAPRRWELGTLEPVRALADSQRLVMALDALIENAIRHTSRDDLIKLSIERADDGTAIIVVEDSGEGIADADLPRVFERGATLRQPGQRGTGLGLAMVEAVARGHGGSATARSRLGHGSRFEIVIPILPALRYAPQPGGSAAPAAPQIPWPRPPDGQADEQVMAGDVRLTASWEAS